MCFKKKGMAMGKRAWCLKKRAWRGAMLKQAGGTLHHSRGHHAPPHIRQKYPEHVKIAENLVGYARKSLATNKVCAQK